MFYFSTKKTRVSFLVVLFAILVACGEPKAPPNIIGTWTGNFVGEFGTTFSITLNITTQNGTDISGNWSSSAMSGSAIGTLSQHYLAGSYDYYTTLITLSSSDLVECCFVLTGCGYQGSRLVQIDGTIDGNTIKGDSVIYVLYCYSPENGSLTLTRN